MNIDCISQRTKLSIGLVAAATSGLATLALSIATTSAAQAAVINGVTATTTLGDVGFNFNSIVNAVGLPGNIPSLTAIHQDSTVNNTWLGSLDTGNLITFNLNGTYSLAGFSLWNFNGFNTIGIKNVNIFTSTDGTNFTTVAGAPTQFAIGANLLPELPEQFSFAPVTASYVRFEVLNNYGFTNLGNGTGLAEVQFDGSPATTAVPEPFTIVGTLIGGTAAVRMRKKLGTAKLANAIG
jgi:F5/8 type C domain